MNAPSSGLSDPAKPAPAPDVAPRWRFYLGAGLLLLVHGLLFLLQGGWVLFSDTPHYGGDFDTHLEQTYNFIDALEGWGKTWAYDVGLLAGYPNGTIFDADNKGWATWTFLVTRLGVSRGFAFNSFVIAAHLAVPFVVYACARGWDMTRRAALVSASLGMGVWFLDGMSHWCWHIGMVAYGTSAYFMLVPLTLFHRYLEDRRWWQAGACAVTLGAAHLLHPYTFVALVLPMLALWLRAWRRLSPGQHAAVVGIAVVTVIMNLWWLGVAVRFWHYVLDSAFFGQGNPKQLLADFFGLVFVPTTSGVIGNRTSVRILALAIAVPTLVSWYRAGDRRCLPLGTGVVAMFAVAYFGTYTFLAQMQPYRFVLPLAWYGCLIAGAGVDRLWTSGALRSTAAPVRVGFLVLGLLAAKHVARDVIYFHMRYFPLPEVMPDKKHTGLTVFGTGIVFDFTMQPIDFRVVDDAVRRIDDGSGRWLVEGPLYGEHFAWATDAQVIGGFTERNLQHAHANIFRRYPNAIVTPAILRTYLDRYAIKWVLTTTPPHEAPWWDAPLYAGILERIEVIGPVRIYRVVDPKSFFIAGESPGGGKIEATTNRIAVSGTDPNAEVILRFHWLETLACQPDCQIGQYEIPNPHVKGLVPFIVVPAGHPRDFEIVNTYRTTAPPAN